MNIKEEREIHWIIEKKKNCWYYHQSVSEPSSCLKNRLGSRYIFYYFDRCFYTVLRVFFRLINYFLCCMGFNRWKWIEKNGFIGIKKTLIIFWLQLWWLYSRQVDGVSRSFMLFSKRRTRHVIHPFGRGWGGNG